MVHVYEQELDIPPAGEGEDLLEHLSRHTGERLDAGQRPVRLAVTSSGPGGYHCELGVVEGLGAERPEPGDGLFGFRRRGHARCDRFNAVMVIPTGVGASLGGHAGDANAAAKLLASVCDTLVTHPNVVNASDVNELPANGLYVEGSVISRLLMGSAGLLPVRANRVLTVLDAHPDRYFSHITLNAVSAARASFGLDCADTVMLDPPVLLSARFASSGRAVGRVERLDGLLRLLAERAGQYDAVALATQIQVPPSYRDDYFRSHGEAVNPWGGVEAIFTHTLSSLFDVPTAHAPMEGSREVAEMDLGVVDPRMAAEAISSSFFLCVLKGLQRAPRIVSLAGGGAPAAGVLAAEDIDCLVIPDGCLGLPTLAALAQGIPVIAVRENRNIMHNDLDALPWSAGQFHRVENYWEAVGVMVALRAGLLPASVRRPLTDTACTSWAG